MAKAWMIIPSISEITRDFVYPDSLIPLTNLCRLFCSKKISIHNSPTLLCTRGRTTNEYALQYIIPRDSRSMLIYHHDTFYFDTKSHTVIIAARAFYGIRKTSMIETNFLEKVLPRCLFRYGNKSWNWLASRFVCLITRPKGLVFYLRVYTRIQLL